MLLVRALRTLVLGIVVGGVAVGACLAALVPGGAEIVSAHHYTVKTVTKLRDLSQKSTVYWSDGVTKMDELGLEDRQNVTYAELAGSAGGQRVINAVISTEDQSFWTNDGIDLGAVFRAFVTNVTSGGIEQGGSTITQQLVKNRILSPARDVNRKVKEIEDALRLNERFSKKKILEEYLNTVYFGQNSYGIKSAASRFFITADPGAVVPTREAPRRAHDRRGRAPRRCDREPGRHEPVHVSRRARSSGGATCSQSEVESGIHHAGRGRRREQRAAARPGCPRTSSGRAASSCPRCKTACSTTPGSATHRRSGATSCSEGGLSIVTTFDKNLQTLADDSVRNALPRSPAGPDWGSSLVAIDPPTGAVKAMSQTSSFADSQYNIGTHPVGRQPGSTWKVITLAAALANGYSANDTHQRQCAVQRPEQVREREHDQLGGAGWRQRDAVVRDRRLGELCVRPALDERGPGQGDGHGAQDGHHPAAPLPAPHALDRRHRGHAARDGHGHGDHRQRRRAPDARTSCRR